MVQIQPLLLVPLDTKQRRLNPTWFRYNIVKYFQINPTNVFKSHMVQIQLNETDMDIHLMLLFKSHMVQIQPKGKLKFT